MKKKLLTKLEISLIKTVAMAILLNGQKRCTAYKTKLIQTAAAIYYSTFVAKIPSGIKSNQLDS